jgi:plasmid stabilization system protein ParE
MIYDVVFTPEAEDTFDLICEQLIQRWGITTLMEFQKLVDVGIKSIAKNPFLYQFIEKKLQLRKLTIHKNCSILYRINEHKVEVICFYDNRQDPMFE